MKLAALLLVSGCGSVVDLQPPLRVLVSESPELTGAVAAAAAAWTAAFAAAGLPSLVTSGEAPEGRPLVIAIDPGLDWYRDAYGRTFICGDRIAIAPQVAAAGGALAEHTVAHEIGHALGLGHAPDGLMAPLLPTGGEAPPTAAEAFAAWEHGCAVE